MTNKIAFTASIASAMLFSAMSALAAGDMVGDPAAGQAKAAACVACHNADGNSTNPEWPKLAGQNARYTVKQLKDLKAQESRKNEIMAGLAAGLSDQDMADIAAFYATQNRTGGFVSEEQLALGQKIYRGGNIETGVPACSGCHGPAGAGDPSGGIPNLSGQHATYSAAQLKAFRSGTRANDANGMMRGSARWLSDAEIAAVSEYMAGLH